jgi:translation initiation factor 2B subunit (eIF-2B alpha/beta/delta family)
MSQIKYKLSDYQASMKNYVEILQQDKDGGDQIGEENLEGNEIMDIITNYLACESAIGKSSVQEIQNLVDTYCSRDDVEKTYEFFFNLSQVHL